MNTRQRTKLLNHIAAESKKKKAEIQISENIPDFDNNRVITLNGSIAFIITESEYNDLISDTVIADKLTVYPVIDSKNILRVFDLNSNHNDILLHQIDLIEYPETRKTGLIFTSENDSDVIGKKIAIYKNLLTGLPGNINLYGYSACRRVLLADYENNSFNIYGLVMPYRLK